MKIIGIGEVVWDCFPEGKRLGGATDTAGYTFDSSIAVVDGKFVGLPLDEVNEDNKTDERISAWVEQVKQEIS